MSTYWAQHAQLPGGLTAQVRFEVTAAFGSVQSGVDPELSSRTAWCCQASPTHTATRSTGRYAGDSGRPGNVLDLAGSDVPRRRQARSRLLSRARPRRLRGDGTGRDDGGR